MKLPGPNIPYRSPSRQRMIDAAVAVVLGLLAALAVSIAEGQQIYLAQPWPAWYANGTYCDANGRCVPNWQMPRPAIAQNQPVPFDRLQPAPNSRPPAPAPKSIYAGPLPPRDEPAATPAPKPPATPAPATAATAEQDAAGWAPAGLVVTPQTTVIYPPAAAVTSPANPDLARAIVKVDGRARRRADELELAIATQNEKLYRALADVPAAVSHAAASDRLAIVGALEKLPAATTAAVTAGLKGMAETVAVRCMPRETVDNSSYTEMLAQILLVAGGSAASVGTGYWLYKLAAIAGSRLVIRGARRILADELRDKPTAAAWPAPAPAPPTAKPTGTETTYVFDRRTQSPVAVDSPPIVEHAPPETHYVPYETNRFARAYQWALEQAARKTGATEVLTLVDSLVKQQLAATKETAQ